MPSPNPPVIPLPDRLRSAKEQAYAMEQRLLEAEQLVQDFDAYSFDQEGYDGSPFQEKVKEFLDGARTGLDQERS